MTKIRTNDKNFFTSSLFNELKFEFNDLIYLRTRYEK